MIYLQVLTGGLSVLILFVLWNKYVCMFMTPYDFERMFERKFGSIATRLDQLEIYLMAIDTQSIATDEKIDRINENIRFILDDIDNQSTKLITKVQEDLEFGNDSLLKSIKVELAKQMLTLEIANSKKKVALRTKSSKAKTTTAP